jgi:hypothetical protein
MRTIICAQSCASVPPARRRSRPGRRAVVRALQERPELERVEFRLDGVDLARELRRHAGIGLRLEQVEELARALHTPGDPVERFQPVSQLLYALHHVLRRLLGTPEARLAHLCFELLQSVALGVDVKDTPSARSRGPTAARAAVCAHCPR